MQRIQKRNEIASKQRWRLEDIYPSQAAWQSDFDDLKKLYLNVRGFEGKLSNVEAIRECFVLSDQIGLLMEKLYVYAVMKHDEDTTDPEHQPPVNMIKQLSVDVGAAMSFIDPELVALPKEALEGFIADPHLAFYRFTLEEKLRQKPHTLPKEQEALLAKAGVMAQAPQTIYSMLNNADMKFPSIRDEEGNEIELTHARYGRLIESKDRRVRKDAFEAMFSSYRKQKNTIASLMNANVQKDVFYASALNYDSVLDMALFGDNIPKSVYTNLITTIHDKLDVFQRYLALRKRVLKLDELHMYDLSVPIVEDFDWTISYDDALELVTQALAPLGDDYVRTLRDAWKSGWIDVSESEGKRSGAYSWGVYRIHPYVLLNHEDTVDGMFTIAHEMGHAMHSHYANRHQEYRYAGYTIFTAEIASTLNESLLMQHLLKTRTDKRQRAYLLTHYADSFRGTVFVQTLFAEFEKIIHELAEQGEPLTVERLNEIYYNLHQLYYGDSIVIDKDIEIGWMRIPHFYTSFYVYKYATGFSAANSFSRRILSGDGASVENYLELLKSGGKDYSLKLLKTAGLDMSTPTPIAEALSVFENVVAELETLV